jgi:hypothetical protein
MSHPGRDLPPGAYSIGGWAGLKAGLDIEARGKILSSVGDQTPVARSFNLQSDTTLAKLPQFLERAQTICITLVAKSKVVLCLSTSTLTCIREAEAKFHIFQNFT